MDRADLKLRIEQPLLAHLERLHRSGLWGRTLEDVAEELIRLQLRQILEGLETSAVVHRAILAATMAKIEKGEPT